MDVNGQSEVKEKEREWVWGLLTLLYWLKTGLLISKVPQNSRKNWGGGGGACRSNCSSKRRLDEKSRCNVL